jgi:hypothetical protein
MSLALQTVADVGAKDKEDPLGVKNPLPAVATLQDIATASATLISNLGQWYAIGGVRQNAQAIQRLIIENELSLVPGFRFECQISQEITGAARSRRAQAVYIRAVAV